ncbi:hypothetical protein [Azospirillum thermophilum]|uniref:DUF945 domain-containing protein n=1 Tax=Azospirillum thermophilum TaxID=2202148 RepID=A0A2S2CTI0_9PROT|nr:hypothetical protein [Azospirillum thermophilum]AWK87811.1 hypothetical protein DEW08_17890 [Azospirillum thermophilum]
MRRFPARTLAAGLIASAAVWSVSHAQTAPAEAPAAQAPAAQAPATPAPATPAPAAAPAAPATAPAAALAPAPAVDDKGAKTLATALKAGLNRWFPAPSDEAEGVTFEWQGEPTVKPSGDHYDVAMPGLSIEDAEGTRFEFGAVLMSLTPQAGGTWDVTATLPSRIAVLEVDDEGEDYKEVATVAIGRQQFKAVWSEALDTILTMDAALGDLSISSPDGKGRITVGSVTAMQDLKLDGATTWSGPSAFSIGNVTVIDDHKREVLKLGGIAVDASYVRADLGKIAELQLVSQRATASGTPPTVAEILPKLQGVLGGTTMKMRLTGLSVDDVSDGTKVNVGHLAFQSGIEGLDQGFSTVSFGLEARDFGITPSPAPSSFVPSAVELGVSVAKLPNAALWKSFSDFVTAVEAEEKAKEAKEAKPAKSTKAKKIEPAAPAPAPADIAMAAVMGALTEAGSELRVDRLSFTAPALSGTANGAVHMASQAATGAVGGATILLRGLDTAVKALQPAKGKKPDQETQDLLGALSMVQALGQLGKDDSGAEVRSYKIDLTEQGQILLNGADMAPLLAGAGGEPAPQEQPKKGSNKK